MRKFVVIILFAFLAASVVALVMRNTGIPATTESSSTTATGDRLIVYYFHHTQRCPTCLKIEELAHNAVHQRFPNELESKSLDWRVVNLDQDENRHFETDFDLITQSLVLVDQQGGKTARWKNLDRIWELVGSETEFADYVSASIDSFRQAD